jgi:Uncharacterized membrane protein
MQEKFKQYGEKLGFIAETEVRIPRGKIDCVWVTSEPVSEYFIAFEFENSVNKAQNVENLVKMLRLPPQMRPRFLVQIYRESLRDDDREYIEGIASKLPITIKIIDSVGNDIEEACVKLIINLFNWIAEYAELSEGLIKRLEGILGKDRIVKIFHYGEPLRSHLRYLDDALRYPKDYLLWLVSIPRQNDAHTIQNEFRRLQEYDIVIISDVEPKYCDLATLKRFLEAEVREKGKSLILTGGFGLTRQYNDLGEENLGGKVGGRSNREVKIAENEFDIGVGLTFKGFNHFKPKNAEVIAGWEITKLGKVNGPALIVNRVGNGRVIIFTSDCSPSWGTPSIKREGFLEMWKQIMEKFALPRNH